MYVVGSSCLRHGATAAPPKSAGYRPCSSSSPDQMPASSRPPDHCKPRLRPALAEAQVLEVGPDLVAGWVDGFDDPALGEGVVKFVLRHLPWPLRARLLVAEAEQEQPTAGLQDG